MDERRLVILGLVWITLNRSYIKFCANETFPTGNIRSMLGITIATLGMFIGCLLIQRVHRLEHAHNLATAPIPLENPDTQINYPSLFFRQNPSSRNDALFLSDETQAKTAKKMN